ncbi:Sigma factor binding protein 1, chloroplastic, partial [Cucurbita argyrosperma subsp. sororia]
MENLKSLPNHLRHEKLEASNYRATMANKPIKVKYISSPMMVKASNEFEFRAIVQKLTGQHSADDAFDRSPQEFNHAFCPPSSTVTSFDSKDCYDLVSSDAYDPIRVGEMKDSLYGFQASYVDVWR